jgi:hypothetical protein
MGRFEGQSYTTIDPPKLTVHVYEAKVQSRRRAYHNTLHFPTSDLDKNT